ncbi:MAG: M20/M25/M40 family metallo-hydrolase [Clostridiales bacterium]|nr:M20/M25/M40 family metallo-hydrolase [Clostridiales bacterium]
MQSPWIILSVLPLLLLAVLILRAVRFRPRREKPVAPVSVPLDADAAARALSALVRCPTVSHPGGEGEDQAAFDSFAALLPQLFPRVHAACALERVGSKGLMYRWPGTRAEHPLILTAHLDVVPADASAWEGDPFSGEIRDGIIHGRGTLDTKCTLSAILTAAETLLGEGFTPARDVYFCFAGDEEVMGHGARDIVALLEARGVKPLCVVDEGGAIVERVFPGVSRAAALIGVAEKGSVHYTLTARARGGHSSAPLPETPVDILAQACLSIRRKPFRFRITPPAAQMIDSLARHSTFVYRLIFANLWLFAPALNRLVRKSGGELNALLRTTAAFTVVRGGDAANVLPPSAKLTVNLRVLPGETVEGTLAALQRKVNDARVAVEWLEGEDPTACSGTDGAGYAALSRAIHEIYPGVLISPYLMIAGSDARHYERICDHVYRFCGMPLSAEERLMIHGVNERIPVAKQADTARFFLRLIRNVQEMGA